MSSEDLTEMVSVSHNILDEVTDAQRSSQNIWSKKLQIKDLIHAGVIWKMTV